MTFDSPEIEFAVAAVREAALLARSVQRQLVTPALTKDDRSPVTVGDFAVQAVVARRLAERLPGSTLIGEESAEALRLEEGIETLEQVTHFVRRAVADATPEEVCGLVDRGSGEPPSEFWTLDPIDGTKGFLRRDQYAVALGKIDCGTVTIGVLGCPELAQSRKSAPGGAGSLVLAVRGEGSWWQPLEGGGDWQPLGVSNRSRRHRGPRAPFRRKVAHERRRNRPAGRAPRHHRPAGAPRQPGEVRGVGGRGGRRTLAAHLLQSAAL